MSRTRSFALGLAFVSSVLAPLRTARAVSLGEIMPLGDSITQGTVAGGYRDPLFSRLTAAGYTFTFVGSSTVNSTAALNAAEQSRHEGHSGYVIQAKDPTDAGGGSGRAGILDNINTWPSLTDPEFILLMIGTNDLDLNYFSANAPSRLDSLITRISNLATGLEPTANLIVAQLTPIVDATKDARVTTFNSQVANIVANHRALGERVSLVDMHTPLLPTATYMADSLHPNQAGYNKVADVWFDGIQAVPEPSTAMLLAAGTMFFGVRRRRR